MPRVLLTRRIPSSVLTTLQTQHTVDLYAGDGAIPRGELLRRVADKDAVICVLTDKIDSEVLDAAPALKVVANIAVGYENIDVAAARDRGVIVTNTPDVLTEAVAEFTWGLILGIARRIAEGDRLTRAGGWKGWALDFMLGTELRGKQLGIVGAGRIGRAVAAKAPVFGMHVVFAKHEMSIDELLVTSDVISLHAPSTPETRHTRSTSTRTNLSFSRRCSSTSTCCLRRTSAARRAKRVRRWRSLQFETSSRSSAGPILSLPFRDAEIRAGRDGDAAPRQGD